MEKQQTTRVLDMTEGSPAKLLVAFALPMFLGNLLQQFYNLADTAIATPLCFLLFSCALNVVLDILFMGPLGLGIFGAAVATVLAQGISAVLGAAYIIRKYP